MALPLSPSLWLRLKSFLFWKWPKVSNWTRYVNFLYRKLFGNYLMSEDTSLLSPPIPQTKSIFACPLARVIKAIVLYGKVVSGRRKCITFWGMVFTVKWGFQLYTVFGIVGLEHFMLVCVDSSHQLRRCFWQGNLSTSEADLTFREGPWNLDLWRNLLGIQRILNF